MRITHRLIPREDREAVGDVLSEEQMAALAFLRTGEAVVHAEGMDGAVRIRVPQPPSRGAGVDGQTLRRRVREALDPKQLERLERALRRKRHAQTLDHLEVRGAADALLFTAVTGRPLDLGMQQLRSTVERVAGTRGTQNPTHLGDLVDMAIEAALLRRALHYRWDESQLADAVAAAREGGDALTDNLARQLRRDAGPHPWCGSCPAPCMYGFEGSAISRDHFAYAAALDLEDRSRNAWVQGVRSAVDLVAGDLFAGVEAVPEALHACAAGHALDSYGVASDRVEAAASLLLSTRRKNDE